MLLSGRAEVNIHGWVSENKENKNIEKKENKNKKLKKIEKEKIIKNRKNKENEEITFTWKVDPFPGDCRDSSLPFEISWKEFH